MSLHRSRMSLHRPRMNIHRPRMSLHRPRKSLHWSGMRHHISQTKIHRPRMRLHKTRRSLQIQKHELPHIPNEPPTTSTKCFPWTQNEPLQTHLEWASQNPKRVSIDPEWVSTDPEWAFTVPRRASIDPEWASTDPQGTLTVWVTKTQTDNSRKTYWTNKNMLTLPWHFLLTYIAEMWSISEEIS
jgi:hypothetical protein